MDAELTAFTPAPSLSTLGNDSLLRQQRPGCPGPNVPAHYLCPRCTWLTAPRPPHPSWVWALPATAQMRSHPLPPRLPKPATLLLHVPPPALWLPHPVPGFLTALGLSRSGRERKGPAEGGGRKGSSCFLLYCAKSCGGCTLCTISDARPSDLTPRSVSPTRLQVEPGLGGVPGVSGATCLGVGTERDTWLERAGRGQTGGGGGRPGRGWAGRPLQRGLRSSLLPFLPETMGRRLRWEIRGGPGWNHGLGLRSGRTAAPPPTSGSPPCSWPAGDSGPPHSAP